MQKYYDKKISFSASEDKWVDISSKLGGFPASFVRVFSSVEVPYELEIGPSKERSQLVPSAFDMQLQSSRVFEDMSILRLHINKPTTAGYILIHASTLTTGVAEQQPKKTLNKPNIQGMR